jgi:putative ubiquitin-RnfH superfamily antitoxin RatB of RatAB toxin-antitoxin module
MDRTELAVCVVYCAPGVVDIVELRLAPGATIRDAIDASGLLARRPELGPTPDAGIWGRRRSLDEVLRDADRVEIYRPLKVDPKEGRRIRARIRRQRARGIG